MKFEQVVHRLTDQVIEAICQTHKKSDPALAFLLDESWVNQCWEAMSEDERQVILFFIKKKGKDILTYRELGQGHLPLSPVRFRVAIAKLRRSGFVYTLRSMWGEQAYFISSEQIQLFGRLCVPMSSDWRSQKLLPESISYHIIDDLLQVLNVVRNGSTSISFSKKGTLHKKDIKKLFQETQITKEMFASFAEAVHPQYPLEIHEAIILDVLMEWGLLKNNQGKLVLGNMEQWLRRNKEDIATEFIEKLFRDRFDPKLSLFFNLMRSLSSNTDVYSVQAILHSMRDFAPNERNVMETYIEPLTKMGFLKSDQEHGDMLFQWKSCPFMPDASVYIQPNFEVIIPSFAPLCMKWELMQIATILRKEEMWVLQLEQDACRSFFESGKNAADVMEILTRYSTVPIPRNVVTAVEQWGKDFEQVSFWDVRLLRISPDLAMEFEQIPAISSLLYEKVGKGSYIVRVQDSNTLAEELEKRGYRFGQVMNFLNQAEEIEDSSIAFWNTKTPEIMEQVESVFPNLEDAIPEWKQIPRMWVSHYSGYRESTMRQLIQQAIQIGLELKLECQGQNHVVRPSQLMNKKGSWTLVVTEGDTKSSEYLIEDIAKIQIVSPF